MKLLKYILSFCIFLFLGSWQLLNAQSTLTFTPNTATQFVGNVASVSFGHHFPTNAGEYIRIEVSANPSHFSFNSSTLITQSNGLYTDVTVPPFLALFQSQIFTSNDNGFFTDVDFAVSLNVIAANCTVQTSDLIVTAKRMTAADIVLETDIDTVHLNIQNAQNTPTVEISKMEGSTCGYAMYKIKSFGKENSTLDLHLPAGATLTNVYNTSGNVVTFTGSNPYSWARTSTNGDYQEHYIVVSYVQPFSCNNNPQLVVDFNTHPCGSNSNITIHDQLDITCDDCTLQPVSKILIATQHRYFPEPDNCRTHTYEIKFDNVSPVPLTVFSLKDFFSGINTTLNEISIVSIKVSLTSLIPGNPPPVFAWTSTAGTASGTLPLNNVIYQGGPEILSSAIGTWTFGAANGSTFPPFSSLKISIVHRLQQYPTSIPPHQYKNKVQVHYKKNGILMSQSAVCESDMMVYTPVVAIQKTVRNLTMNSLFSSSAAAGPSDVIEFKIRIRNEGMSVMNNVKLKDIISELPVSNISLPYNVTVTGTPEYTAAAKAAILSAINASITPTGFSTNTFSIKEAPCLGASELVIRYKVKVKAYTQVFCNSDYTNTATLMQDNMVVASSEAKVNIDLFRNISYALEATCDTTMTWNSTGMNAVPGRTIYYRARVKNNNNYPVTVRIMIQLPNGLAADNTSTHTSLPSNVTLLSTTPAGPGFVINGNVTPAAVRRNGVNIAGLTLDWLGTSLPAPANVPASSKALYYVVTLQPLSSSLNNAVIRYNVNAPVNYFGSVYTTAMGVTLANYTASTTSCPRVRQRDFALTISQSDPCGSVSGCDLIFFDKKIEKLTGNNYKITLSNILNLSGNVINYMDVVMGQPYKNCMNSSSTPPYIKTMLPFTIGSSVSSTGGQFTSLPVTAGQRFYHLLNNSPSTQFGDVSFTVSIPNVPASPSCGILFPVNIVYKDNQKPCTLCEKTIYLNSVLSTGPPH